MKRFVAVLIRKDGSVIKFVMLVAVSFALVACGNSYQDAGIEATCKQWDYIYYSGFDTVETVNQAFELNMRREAFCYGIEPNELKLR